MMSVDLVGVILRKEFRRPEQLRADLSTQPLPLLHVSCRAEVTQRDDAIRVDDVAPVHKEVVTLDVSVNDRLAMQILDARRHLPGNVNYVEAVDLALFL
eukprot:CAMPEP_0117608536 /NCGR_PEP_ID=MMETSP0784-20121206/80858_1 /TAXON_ID=39447 /ORGANISM="" /LENGTH=98 /DNA_ID=CAMNT_0005411811 /DNA_START=362 /DNA_END=658 /DNA_ORIENTATION=+